MEKAHILQEIKRTAKANGGVPLGRKRFLAETGIREADWLGRFWARWGDAVREAGYSPNQLNPAYETEFLLESYVGLIREIQKVPASGDLRLKAGNDPDFPNWKTFDRLGSKAEVMKQVIEFCQQRPGYEDVIALCQQYALRETKGLQQLGEKNNEGFVYLMKSGKFYKLGRSNAAGRREYELGIQLPEKLKTVHVIRTDDPAGIEAYWHKRFEAKRKNGEWFDLGAVDVAAFKRRKFM